MTRQPQLRWNCPDCGGSGWYTPTALHILDPRFDHSRPDGRVCRKAAAKKIKGTP